MPAVVELKRVALVFPELWERIDRALDWGGSLEVDRVALRQDVMVGKRTLWLVPDPRFPRRLSSVIVTLIVPRAREAPLLEVQLIAGRHIGTWINTAARTLGRYVEASGCTRIHVICRKGWRHWCVSHFGMPMSWSESADHHHNSESRLLHPKHPV